MERLELAKRIVLQAGELLRQAPVKDGAVRQKNGHQDLVTKYDQQVEQFLRREINADFPDDTIVGEEYPVSGADKEHVIWYLDPIDGTTNFINQHRNYAVSVGCYRNGSPLFGVVLDVERRALYMAETGNGAFRNGERLKVSEQTGVSDMLLLTPGILHTFLRPHAAQSGIIRLAQDVRGVRCMGSVVLELCAVAAGEAELFVTLRSSPWDHNAARIILKEAGGELCTLDGAYLPQDQNSTILAANSAVVLERIWREYVQP